MLECVENERYRRIRKGGGWGGLYSRIYVGLGLLTRGASQNSKLGLMESQISRVRRVVWSVAHRIVRSKSCRQREFGVVDVDDATWRGAHIMPSNIVLALQNSRIRRRTDS
jgi:hypothetical protein